MRPPGPVELGWHFFPFFTPTQLAGNIVDHHLSRIQRPAPASGGEINVFGGSPKNRLPRVPKPTSLKHNPYRQVIARIFSEPSLTTRFAIVREIFRLFSRQHQDGPIGKAEAEYPGKCRQAAERSPGAATVGKRIGGYVVALRGLIVEIHFFG
jgi:hypothetical protein